MYGGVGLALVLGDQWLGGNLFKVESPTEAWQVLPWMAGIGGPVGLPVAGIW